jgi:hypothetical protein
MRPNRSTAAVTAAWVSGGVGDVELDGQQVLMGADGSADPLGVAAGGDHGVTGSQGGLGDVDAHPAPCAGDEPGLLVSHLVVLSITPQLATPGQASGGDRHLMFCEVRDNLARLTTSGLERADTRPSWREPRSPATPRVEGSGRTVLACPTPSRKRRRPTRHPSQLGRVEEGLQQLDGQQHLGQPQGPGPGPLHRLAAAAAARRSG